MEWLIQQLVGYSNDELVSNLVRDGVLKLKAVEAVMRRIDRRQFTRGIGAGGLIGREASPEVAYRDAPVAIADGATISAPHMHARCLEILAGKIGPSSKALDVGSGSGYLTLALSMLSTDVSAHGIERDQELVDLARTNVAAVDPSTLDRTVYFHKGDGWAGLPHVAPFDVIHVGAAAHSVPKALLEQLAPGGRMLIPVGKPDQPQQLVQVDKRTDGQVDVTTLFGVRYVELVDERLPKRTFEF